ncbi:dihydrolipoamide dehydrogenase [Rhodothalassium salexigens DSM 2132]|uniref:Dihydrolipoyl dehydrogenase n=1 Tax=Rhodothalassium salexigens DSM 2132 TaxID=1188247 RepID=A0A4R2PVT7_RHOSA|nr:dihydrolipoyl dehydrogenase [Rhodothalassium salexigens]MBB4210096.1 dihydrolipoamide dehydrogenase [Rhodothalassium salexigens DSM 2132]MBK1638420.1 dihydrolipoyl dehydrogenase [Rhodothalassium salexigens DSM 2132]TCP38261.1 dihydrolipoamide dehydrogenase [Rhodothalassium salexigens DSM 2132]
MATDRYDLIVLGAGPGGYVAAIRAAQLGMKTAIVERENLGGICLNWGCIPTKALLRSSEVYHHLHRLKDFGLHADNPGFDLDAVVKRSRSVAGQLNRGVGHLLKKHKVTTIMGTGRLTGPGTLSVETQDGTQTLAAAHILLATGARARELDHLKADGERIWTYRHAMTPKAMPKSLLVIGSGAIGIEFASFYADMGAEVTVVEAVDRILPVEDPEISQFVAKQLTAQGLTLHTGASVDALTATRDAVEARITLADGTTETRQFDRAILAIGIVGNTEGLGLEDLGVRVERGHVVTDQWGATGIDGVWAIGDLTGPPWLAHKASHEGVAAVERMAGLETAHPLDTDNIPGCTYARPQVASVGLTESQAKDAGYEVKIGRFPFIGNGKAIALGEPEGLVKTVFDAQTGALLGAHMVGAEVTELIQGYVIARQLEATEEDLMRTVFPHPTLSEMMHESVLDAFGRVIHY